MLLALLIFPTLLMASEITPSDTTIYVNGKKLVIKESNEKIKIKVYEQKSQGDTIENDQIFEGIYRDGKSSERRMSNCINIPIPKLGSGYSSSNYITDPHWGGIGIGFASVSDSKMNVNNVNGVDLVSGRSKEIIVNFYERAWNISKRGWAIVSGTGLQFDTYRIDGNKAFIEVNGITELQSAPAGRSYTSSKLHTTYFTIPLLLEYQKRLHHSGPLFLSAGVVGNLKLSSSSKVRYNDETGKHKDKIGKDLNIRPVSMDFLIQGGVGCFGMYAKYSPLSIFEGGKGPVVHPVSIGVILHMDM